MSHVCGDVRVARGVGASMRRRGTGWLAGAQRRYRPNVGVGDFVGRVHGGPVPDRALVDRPRCGRCRRRTVLLQPGRLPTRDDAVLVHARSRAPDLQRLVHQRRHRSAATCDAPILRRATDRRSRESRATAHLYLRGRERPDRACRRGDAAARLLREVVGAGEQHLVNAAAGRGPYDADASVRQRVCGDRQSLHRQVRLRCGEEDSRLDLWSALRHAGYDTWAQRNGIVVLFPQAVSIPLLNPNGCWDWWGYTDANYANREGVQIAAIRAMVDRISSGMR